MTSRAVWIHNRVRYRRPLGQVLGDPNELETFRVMRSHEDAPLLASGAAYTYREAEKDERDRWTLWVLEAGSTWWSVVDQDVGEHEADHFVRYGVGPS